MTNHKLHKTYMYTQPSHQNHSKITPKNLHVLTKVRLFLFSKKNVHWQLLCHVQTSILTHTSGHTTKINMTARTLIKVRGVVRNFIINHSESKERKACLALLFTRRKCQMRAQARTSLSSSTHSHKCISMSAGVNVNVGAGVAVKQFNRHA